MLGDELLVACGLEEPVAAGVRVGHGLKGGEGLGCDEEECGLGIAALQDLGSMGAVDVGDEVHLEVVLVGPQGLGDHDRAQIGSADSDVDDALDCLAGIALPLAGDDLLGEGLHLGKDALHIGHHILSVNEDRLAAHVAEGGMKNCAALGAVDLLAAEHRLDGIADAALLCELAEKAHGGAVNEVLGVVNQHVIAEFLREMIKAAGISLKE